MHPTGPTDAIDMNLLALLLSAFVGLPSASSVGSSLDFHVNTDNQGVHAQLVTDIRNRLHATMTYEPSGVTGQAQVALGPGTITLTKASGEPLRVDIGGLGMTHATPGTTAQVSTPPDGVRLIAATIPAVPPRSAGFLENLATFAGDVLYEIVLWVDTVIPFLLLGLLLMLLFPSLGGGVRATAMRAPWERLGIGVIALVAMPSAGIALLIGGIVLGVWWLGILELGLYAVALAAGYTFTGMIVGRAIFDRTGLTNLHIFWALLGGLAVISALALIPYVGVFVAVAAVTYGMGALALAPRTPEATALPRTLLQRQQVRPRQEIAAPARDATPVAHQPGA